MNIRKYVAGLLATAAAAAVLGTAPSAWATLSGDSQGCTPGFWKNHTDWASYAVHYAPDETVAHMLKVPGVPGDYQFPAALSSFQHETMLQALQGGGGPGVTGATQILLRASVAAYLNADVEILYPYRRWATGFGGRAPLQTLITSALTSQDRATMLDLAAKLDDANNLGCPLS
jgi:hypothetical protein